jgi:GxxExxY protein
MENAEKIYPLSDETYKIIGICMEVHKILGRGMLEVVYKDAVDYEFKINNIQYQREKQFRIEYKDIILPHYFHADFVVFDKIILEIKAQKGLVDEHFKWVLNYLAISGCPLGLVINFGKSSLETRRIIL